MPKLLKSANSGDTEDGDEARNSYLARRDQSEKILSIVKKIAKSLVEYTRNKKSFSDEFKHFTLKSH